MRASEAEIEVLETGIWFHGLPAGLKESLSQIARHVELGHGEVLFRRGDPRCGLYAVLGGMVRISGLNEQGKEAILTFVEAPDWIGEVALFDGEPRTHNALAEGRLNLLHFPQADLDKLLKQSPHYWRQFGQLLAHKLRLSFTALEDLALLPASIRLSRRLVLMAEGYGVINSRHRKTLSVPQEQLGRMLSISRQTTNQILKELAQQGLIRIAYGHIEICDLEKLKAASGVAVQADSAAGK